MGIILENDAIISNVFYHSNTIVSNKINMLERNCFMVVVAAFLENIKELNYNYQIITEIMVGIKIYLFKNIDKFELGTEDCFEQTSIIEDKINSVIESAIEIKQYRRKLN